MLLVGFECDNCKHQRENIDGWKCACDAFPEGIPDDYFSTKLNPKNLSECNNGISYEHKDEKNR